MAANNGARETSTLLIFQRQIPQAIRRNAEGRRVLTSPVPAPETFPALIELDAAAVERPVHEIYVQCLYLLSVSANAPSLYDVATDIHHLCVDGDAARQLANWHILAIDAIGVVPAAGNATRPARATRYAWCVQSELLSLTDPKGGVTRFRCDHAGRLDESGKVVWLGGIGRGVGRRRSGRRYRSGTRRGTQSGSRGSIVMRRRGCITTGIGTTIRTRDGTSLRTRSGWPVA